jgi:hypothetical protein
MFHNRPLRTLGNMVMLFCTISMVAAVSTSHFEVKGEDQPYVPQPSYLNSTISVYGAGHEAPGVFDDQLKSWIKQYIVPKGYHDMKFVFGQCYGGGMIDEMLEFGDDSHPVAAMSASKYNEISYGDFSGSYDEFLEALKNALNTNPDLTMKQAFDEAKGNDPSGPGNKDHAAYPEHPQYNSKGAGADNLKLGNKGSATSWKAILFAGDPERRHWNDMDRTCNLLTQKFGFSDADIEVCAGNGQYNGNGGNTLPGGGTIDRGGTAADLENAIKAVADKMNSNEQLFFWVTDHGDSDGLIDKATRYITGTFKYLFSAYDWMISAMRKITTNSPFIKMFTNNVTSLGNGVYLNDHFLGYLSMIEGEQILYFDDNVVPLYVDTNNTLNITSAQGNPLAVSDVYISSGAIPTIIKEVGGVGAQERFGPRLDNLLIEQYASVNAMFAALDAGEIDIADAPVTDPWLTQWASKESIVLSPCPSGWKACGKYYSGGNDGSIVGDSEDIYRRSPGGARCEWLGITNEFNFGVNCWGTFLNAYPNGSRYGNGHMTIRYGFSTMQPLSLNPLYSTSFWEWQVLDKIYDTLMKRDPYTLQIEPWLAESWTVGTWDDNGVDHTKVTVTIRSDAKFMDGMPVTLADIVFSLVEAGPLTISKGFPLPSSYLQDAKSFAILDAYTLEILFDVLDPAVLDAIVSVPILPKHIWKPIIETGDPTTFAPDPNFIGSGPFRYKQQIPQVSLLMVANSPGSVVTTDQPGAVPITSPGYQAWLPVEEYVSTPDGKHKYNPDTAVTLNVRTANLWLGGPLDISDHVVITWPNASQTFIDYTITGLAAGTSDTHALGPYIWPKCRTLIEVTSTITTVDTPWTGQSFYAKYFIWGTIREDITGSTYHKDMGLIPPYSAAFAASVPTPDCKVDVKDVAGAAAAFGSKPSQLRWWSVADIVHDYKINAKDIAAIASKFGWK